MLNNISFYLGNGFVHLVSICKKKNIEKENVKIIEIEGNRKWLPSGDLFNNGGRRLPGGAPAVYGVWGRRFP